MKKLTREQMNQLAVLGAAILEPEHCGVNLQRLTAEMFEAGELRELYEVIRRRLDAGQGVDALTIINEMGEGARQLVTLAAETVPTLSNVDTYEGFVVEDHRRRLLTTACGMAMQELTSDQMCNMLRDALTQQEAIQQATLDGSAAEFDTVVDEALDAIRTQSNALYLRWRAVDRFGLFERGNVVVLSGRPGGGKTDLAINLACRLSTTCRVYYLTMEETRRKLMHRILSKVTRIDSGRIRDKQLTEQEMDSLENAANALKNRTHSMVLDDGQSMTVHDLRGKLLRHKPDVVFIDHIGLLKPTNPRMTEYERLAEATRELKLMAIQHNVVIVELCQLNRQVDKTGGSRSAKLADLRGSGTIEQDANAVLCVESSVQEDEELRGADAYKDVSVRVQKNRDGGTGGFVMRWQPQYHSWQPAPDAADDWHEVTTPLPESVQQQFYGRTQ